MRLDRVDIGDPNALFAAAGDSVAGARGIHWRAVDADSLGRVDLYSVLPQPVLDDRAAYALTYIATPEARTVRLAVESDDDVVIWLNGRRVHRHDVGRELRSSADTITLALARGDNRLLYKVVNRGGGFGLGGRLLSASRDPTGDLRADVSNGSRDRSRMLVSTDTATATTARGDATLGPVSIDARAHLNEAGLRTTLRVCATRWSHETRALILAAGGATVAIPANPTGAPMLLTVDADWSQLARGVLDGNAHVLARESGNTVSALDLPLTADRLLTQLSRPIAIERWRGDRHGAAIDSSTDSLARHKLRKISAGALITAPLAGLTLDAEAAEFGGHSMVRVDTTTSPRDSLGRVTVCAPCRGGVPVTLSVDVDGVWWDPPRVRVRELGWAEIRDGAEWARYFTGDSTIAAPDTATALALLRAALDGSKIEYHAIVARSLAELEPSARTIRRDTIDLVGHSHIDAAWTWRWREGEDVVQRTWATTAKLMRKYPDMHFAASSAQYYQWLEQRDPALLTRITSLARDGRWEPVGGWWVEADANMPSGESLVRQALYGQRTFTRLFGKPARVAWLPNSFGFAWSLPQILRKSGFEFFVTEEMRWNDTNRWPPSANAFWWEGADGSRIFTDMIFAYDHDLAPRRLAKEFVVTRDSSATRRMMTVYGVGDHGGGPTIAMLDRARDLERVPAFPVVRDASPESSLSRMRRDATSGPVIRDELYLEYHRGTYTTQAHIKRRNRELESLLHDAEAAATFAPLPYPHDSLRVAWERMLFNQFHDILPGTSTAEVYRDAEEDYAHARSIGDRVLQRSLLATAAGLDTRSPVPGAMPYLVFNATGRVRTGLVRLPLRTEASVYDAAGRPLPSAIEDSVLTVRVPAVPALGTALVFVGPPARESPSKARASLTLENAALRVDIDSATGNIMRMYDKARHAGLLSRGAGALLTFEDQPQLWDAWNIDNLAGARAAIDRDVRIGPLERTPLGDAIEIRRSRGETRVSERYVLRDDPARLDIAMTVGWHESHHLLKLVLPLKFHVDSTRAEIPYASIARTTRPLSRRDSARFETPMQRWVDASGKSFGVAVINDGKYGYSAHADSLFITLLRSPKSPDPDADMGVQRMLLSIVPHGGDWRASEIGDAAREVNEPMIAMQVAPHRGSTAPPSWLAVQPSSVEVSSVKRAEDGEHVVVRLVETTGYATHATLQFAAPVIASEVDLLERPVVSGGVLRGREITVSMRAFDIRTFEIAPLDSIAVH